MEELLLQHALEIVMAVEASLTSGVRLQPELVLRLRVSRGVSKKTKSDGHEEKNGR